MFHYGRCPCLPGTLTVTIGSKSVTLDPIEPREKFNQRKAEVEQMLIEIDTANHANQQLKQDEQ